MFHIFELNLQSAQFLNRPIQLNFFAVDLVFLDLEGLYFTGQVVDFLSEANLLRSFGPFFRNKNRLLRIFPNLTIHKNLTHT